MTKTLITLLTISMFILTFSTSSSGIAQNKIKRTSALSIRKPNVTILMMFPDIDRFIPNLKSLRIVYEYIVQRYEITKWLNITLHVRDSNCSIALAPHMLVNTMLSTIPNVVFGPFCGKYIHACFSSGLVFLLTDLAVAPVARLLHFQNIPLITMGAVSNEFTLQRQSMYSSLFRFGYRTDELGKLMNIHKQN